MKRLVLAFLLAGCQVYEFQPVEPLTIVAYETPPRELRPVLKPNVMLLVDRSASMNQATSSGNSRMADLKAAVAAFTMTADDRVRLGLTVFPQASQLPGAAGVCQTADSIAVNLPPASLVDDAQASQANRTAALQVNAAVQGLMPVGGTPTGGALRFLGTTDVLRANDFRNDFVLLLTDGLPNCNANNPYDFRDARCQCQTTNGSCSDRLACLDADGSTEQVAALARAGTKTIVVGFGADIANATARDVLERLASAGGVTRQCQADADCGAGDRCTIGTNADMGRCGRNAWQAANQLELERVLSAVLEGLQPLACAFELPDRPLNASGAGITVLVNGAPAPRSKWTLANDHVVLEKAYCEANTGATVQLKMVTLP